MLDLAGLAGWTLGSYPEPRMAEIVIVAGHLLSLPFSDRPVADTLSSATRHFRRLDTLALPSSLTFVTPFADITATLPALVKSRR